MTTKCTWNRFKHSPQQNRHRTDNLVLRTLAIIALICPKETSDRHILPFPKTVRPQFPIAGVKCSIKTSAGQILPLPKTVRPQSLSI